MTSINRGGLKMITKKELVANIMMALYLCDDIDKLKSIHKRHFNQLMKQRKCVLQSQQKYALAIINDKLVK